MNFLQNILNGSETIERAQSERDINRDRLIELIASDDCAANYIRNPRLVTLEESGRHKLNATEIKELNKLARLQWDKLAEDDKERYRELANSSSLDGFAPVQAARGTSLRCCECGVPIARTTRLIQRGRPKQKRSKQTKNKKTRKQAIRKPKPAKRSQRFRQMRALVDTNLMDGH